MLGAASGFLCLHHRAEPFHHEARLHYEQARSRITHSYVLAEFVALAVVRRLPRMPALPYMADLLDNPDVEVVWADEDLHREAMALFSPDETKRIPSAMLRVTW